MANMANATMGGSKSMEPVPAPNVGKAAEPASVPAPNVGKAAESPVSAPTPEAAAVSAPTPKPAAVSTPTPAPATTPMPTGDCRDVRDEAKRANRNARCQNTYCFLLHGALSPIEVVGALQRWRADSPKCNCRLRREFPRRRS
jgi:hypothetical protein